MPESRREGHSRGSSRSTPSEGRGISSGGNYPVARPRRGHSNSASCRSIRLIALRKRSSRTARRLRSGPSRACDAARAGDPSLARTRTSISQPSGSNRSSGSSSASSWSRCSTSSASPGNRYARMRCTSARSDVAALYPGRGPRDLGRGSEVGEVGRKRRRSCASQLECVDERINRDPALRRPVPVGGRRRGVSRASQVPVDATQSRGTGSGTYGDMAGCVIASWTAWGG